MISIEYNSKKTDVDVCYFIFLPILFPNIFLMEFKVRSISLLFPSRIKYYLWYIDVRKLLLSICQNI